MINKAAISLKAVSPLEAAIALVLSSEIKERRDNELQRAVQEAYYFPGIPKVSSLSQENGDSEMMTKLATALIVDHYARQELNGQQKTAELFSPEAKNFLLSPKFRIPASAVLGAGVGAGGAALAGEDDAKVLALAGLLGGGAGAYLGSNAIDAAFMRGHFPGKFQPGAQQSLANYLKG